MRLLLAKGRQGINEILKTMYEMEFGAHFMESRIDRNRNPRDGWQETGRRQPHRRGNHNTQRLWKDALAKHMCFKLN